jgi:hypothetical protein
MLEFLLLVSSDLQRYIEKLKHQAFSVLFFVKKERKAAERIFRWRFRLCGCAA